ncbi:MAG: two-component system sensor histidine kinase RegB [Pseudomonadales bacterium]|jgi:two-component system sensor histidine kinase RegB
MPAHIVSAMIGDLKAIRVSTTVIKAFNSAAIATNLQRLCLIRVILLIGITVALAIARSQNITVATTSIAWVISILAIYTTLCWFRLRQSWPVTEQEFFAHIFSDIGFLTALLYFSGGATNPFVSYFLIPLSISAITLPWAYTISVAVLSVVAYSLLLFFYIPLAIYAPSHHSDGLNIHILGMWINFVLSAGLITYFVVGMASALREQQQTINRQKEDSLRDQQIMAVATLAAGTAHELGTPLATMNILLEELNKDAQPGELQEDLTLLLEQVTRCKSILTKLTNTAQISHAVKEAISVRYLIDQVLDNWLLMRPEVSSSLIVTNDSKSPHIDSDATLKQAITNLLDNAADACTIDIKIILSWDNKMITLAIEDNGPGIPIDMAEQIGKPFITTKGKGLGLGLSLSHATIERFGGTVQLFNKQPNGTLTQLQLPISKVIL